MKNNNKLNQNNNNKKEVLKQFSIKGIRKGFGSFTVEYCI